MISYEELSEVFDMDNPLTLEYFELVDKDTDEPKYFEKHHILPRSMFKQFVSSVWNKIKLSYKDHYRSHEILPFICLHERDRIKMARAWRMMTRSEFCTDPETYAILRQMHKDAMSGKNNPNYGKSPSEETRKKLSDRAKSREYGPATEEVKALLLHYAKTYVKTPEERKAASDRLKGVPRSEETKKKVSEGHKGKKHSVEHVAKRSKTTIDKGYVRFMKHLSNNTNLSLVGEYFGLCIPTTFACSEGHKEFSTEPRYIEQRGRRCSQCKKEGL